MQNNIFSGLFVGQNLVTLKEVDSTNTFLKNLASNSKPLPEGTVIMAEDQFAGRGQQQSKWHSEPGKNLTFSILLKPSFLNVLQQFDLTRAISLGVYDALCPLLGDELKIKWPNDIYYHNKKMGGMLIENMVQGDKIKNSIVGIGLNVNQDNFYDNAPNATSVKQILHTDYDLKVLLADICSHIEARYLALKAGKAQQIRECYLQCLYRINEPALYKAKNDIFEGRIVSVSDTGLLIIEKPGDETAAFNLKEVEFINNQI